MNVAVLMSTYNGEKYIKEQIESILGQENVSVEIFIRDDGSIDHTVDIVEKYDNINIIRGENIGVGNSFMELVYKVPNSFEFYAFADQDDIWLNNKMEKGIEKIRHQKGPILYCSNQRLIDKYGSEIGVRFNRNPDLSSEKIFVQNSATGCTMIWNRELQNILLKKRPAKELLYSRIHDVWVAMVASICGTIIYDKNGYILYRQHENNVVGARKKTRKDILVQQIKKIKRKDLRCGRSLLAKQMKILFPKESEKCKAIIWGANSTSFSGKLNLIFNNRYFRKYSNENLCAFIFKVVFELF